MSWVVVVRSCVMTHSNYVAHEIELPEMCMAAQCIGKTLAIPGTEWRKESAGYPGEHPADIGSFWIAPVL